MLAEKLQKRGGGREWLLNQIEAEKEAGPGPAAGDTGTGVVKSASGVGSANVRINAPLAQPAAGNLVPAPPSPPGAPLDKEAQERALRVKRAMADLRLDSMLEKDKMNQQVGAS